MGPEITAAIVSHSRKKQLLNMIWQLENQIVPFKEIKLYVSGYEPDELAYLAPKYQITYCRDLKDWGHDKRSQAINECTTPYILCAGDDDIYVYHFTEAITKAMEKDPGAQIYATDWRTQKESSADYYGYHIVKPELNNITSGCMVLDADFVRQNDCYKFRDYGADGRLAEAIMAAGGRFVRVPYMAFFHY
jgi:Glycosyl transferase family 2